MSQRRVALLAAAAILSTAVNMFAQVRPFDVVSIKVFRNRFSQLAGSQRPAGSLPQMRLSRC